MNRDELMTELFKYGEAVKRGDAGVQDFTRVKNAIRQSYDTGNIDKELMKQLGDKASFSFKNMGKALDLGKMPEKIVEKGGAVGAVEGMKSRFPSVTDVMARKSDPHVSQEGGLIRGVKNVKGFAKMLPILGLGATALAGLSIANKAAAGELGEAGMETADVATDYIPGVGQLKMALRPSELGSAELPPEMMKERELYNVARRSKDMQTVNNPSEEQPLLAPEDRAKYEDMQNQFKNVMSRIKK